MHFIKLLRRVFSNIFIVFKNFFHWTASKIIIVVFCFFLAVVSFFPFLIPLVILGFIDPINWSEIFLSFNLGTPHAYSLYTAFASSPVFFMIEAIITIIWLIFAIGVYHFKSVLLYRVIESYRADERQSLKKTMSIKGLWIYIRAFLRIIWFLSLPFVLYLVLGGILFFLYWGAKNVLQVLEWDPWLNFPSLFLLTMAFVALLSFFYIYYRCIFIYPIIWEWKHTDHKKIFQISFLLTSWKSIFFIVWCVIIYAIATQPTRYLENHYETSHAELWRYFQMRSYELIPKNESFQTYGITQFQNYDEVLLDPEFLALDAKYSQIQVSQAAWVQANYLFYMRLIFIINFLIFYGLYEVCIWTLYGFLWEKKKIQVEKKQKDQEAL